MIEIQDVNGNSKQVEESSKEALGALQNSAAVVLAAILKAKYPSIRLGNMGSDEDEFFLDSDKDGSQVSSDELGGLEDEIKSSANKQLSFVQKSLNDSKELLANDPYSLDIVKSKKDSVDFAEFNNELVLAPEGYFLKSLKSLAILKLLSVAGAYWQGKSSNPMLQRIYGTAFFNKKDLDSKLKKRQEARERDHRVIGNDLDLFFVDPKVGAGLPYWLPNGATIRRVIERYIIDKEVAHGYQHVYTPVLMNLDVYKTSGHWQHYRQDMFPPMDMGDGEQLELRPMNCPSHIQIYNHHIRSYRELPLRIAELGMMHRYEKSGALSGLQRVREMTLNDGHTFVAPDQIGDEFKRILNLMVEVYKDFNITDYTFRLSYRDPKNTTKYFDDDEMWNTSQSMLENAMDELGLDYYEAEGEAAFYGPKLDVQTKTALGNDETLSTIQLDFMMPKQFDLHYIGEDGQEHRPIMIHRGLVSTMERFVAYLTEIYKGAFPVWLSPVQVKVIPVSDSKHGKAIDKLVNKMNAAGMRAVADHRNEKMGYLIRDAQAHKIPYTLVIGDNELNNDEVSVRKYGEKETSSISSDKFITDVKNQIDNHQ